MRKESKFQDCKGCLCRECKVNETCDICECPHCHDISPFTVRMCDIHPEARDGKTRAI
jgi:hypothetical protein